MHASDRGDPAIEAGRIFARLLERRDRGEEVDFEAEFRAAGPLAGELRSVYQGWRRLEGAFDGLARHESALESAVLELQPSGAPLDAHTLAFLERLAAPDRGARRYERLELLARGGMGEVWRVRDRDLGREVAMKILRVKFRRDAQGRSTALLRRFLAEARLVARLDHPGILPLFDVGVGEDERIWFTLPLVRGESMAEMLARGDASRPAVLEIVLRLCDALAYAHAQGIVHRDLKPANVMVGRFGEAYVVDWGLAMLDASFEPALEPTFDGEREHSPASGETRHGDVLGTPAYMAPEQAEGRLAAMGPLADVYSLGAILYHALAGRPPYDASTKGGVNILAAVRAGPPEPLARAAPGAPSELAAICEKAMSRDPAERYADVRAMAADLRAFLSGRVVRAHRTGAWPELVAWTRRNSALAFAVCAAVALAAVLLLAWSVQRDRLAREVLSLADVARLKDLERRAETIGPPSAEHRADFEAWLADAEALAARRALHEQNLASLRARAREDASAALSFASDEDRWRHEVLGELVAGLERLADPDPRRGGIASVRERLRLALELERASLVDAAPAWNAAIDALADPARFPAYDGLRLRPQLGLVPLGRDPDSGLEEFAHLASGVPPSRGADGRLVLAPESAIVLVLLPGGSFRMGANPAEIPGIPESDTWAGPDEGPRRTVALAPVFVAKYEIDQAQWERLSGANPSWSGRGRAPEESALLPVESLDWNAARGVLARSGLLLPTEAQWEYAARGGTVSRWWSGNEPGSLRGAVHGRSSGDPRLRSESDDKVLAIDALRGNGFGLHHVLGNVAEWTLDPWSDEPTSGLRSDDGFRQGPDSGLRALRGGSYISGAVELRCAARDRAQVELRDRRVGVRPVRPIDP